MYTHQFKKKYIINYYTKTCYIRQIVLKLISYKLHYIKIQFIKLVQFKIILIFQNSKGNKLKSLYLIKQ